MEIKLYNFDKKTNSTKTPGATVPYTGLTGKIRAGCSLISPDIDFKLDQFEYAPAFNYAYIDSFKRYYFIDEWTFTGGLWTASMSADVLASFKEDIGADREYVLRSASDKNGNIIDTYYPSAVNYDIQQRDISSVIDYQLPETYSNYFDRDFLNGVYVFGVIGSEGRFGVTYYYATPGAFKTIINNLMNYQPTDFGDIGAGLSKQLANPIQYITNCRWYPTPPGRITQTTRSIKLGYYTINAICDIVDDVDPDDPLLGSINPSVHHYYANFDISEINHPQSSRGAYMNTTGSYRLTFNPFGSFNINGVDIASSLIIGCDWWVDFTTGQAWLEGHTTQGSLLFTSSSQFGVDVPVAQLSFDVTGTVGAAAGGLFNTGIALATGNVVGAISNALTGIAGVTSAAQPTSNTKGTVGSLLSFKTRKPKLYVQFQYFATDDNTNNGSPLCAIKRLDQLSGFTKVSNSHFSSDKCLQTEIEMIKNYLNNGVYIE